LSNNNDFGYLTITINGVDELPIANDNANSVTQCPPGPVTGNVIFDDDGFGADSGDRPLAQLIWENLFANGAVVNGTSRLVNGVNVSFITSDPGLVGTALNQTVTTTTNGGHTGYLLFNTDASVNPAPNNTLTINFDIPVTNLFFTITDIDYSQGTSWQDLMRVRGFLDGSNVTYTSKPNGSIVTVGPDTFYGTGNVPPNDAHGNVSFYFDTPVNQLVFDYNYGPQVTDANPGGQIAGITDLNWQDSGAPRIFEVFGSTANVGVSVATTYGFITINNDGSYSYTLDCTNPTVAALVTGANLTDTIPYTLIDSFDNSGNRDTANLIITITGFKPIDALNDGPITVASAATPITVQNVTSNDTLNGVAVTAANTDVTPVTSGPLSVDANGVLTLAANTPSGTYTITYELCETGASPANCDTATATVVVANPIDAVNDGPVTVASNNTVVTAVNALANDTLAGIAATTANTNVTPLTSGPLSIDADGIVTVAANTPSGTYTITYQLCE
ncbi:MAG: VCBS domain-containing protein, partial [Dolichospermum sp.]